MKKQEKLSLVESAFGRFYGDQQFPSGLRVCSLFHSCWWQAYLAFSLLEVLESWRVVIIQPAHPGGWGLEMDSDTGSRFAG